MSISYCNIKIEPEESVAEQNDEVSEGVIYPKQLHDLAKKSTNTPSENEHNSLNSLEIEPEFVNIKLEIDTFDATVKQEHTLDSDEDAQPLSLHKPLGDASQPARVTIGQIFEVEIKQEPIEADFEPNTHENQHLMERSFQDQTLVEGEGSSSRAHLTSPIRRKRSTTSSVGEQEIIINIYKYVRSTWPEDTYLSNDKIIEKTSEISGVSKRTIYRILAEYRDTHTLVEKGAVRKRK